MNLWPRITWNRLWKNYGISLILCKNISFVYHKHPALSFNERLLKFHRKKLWFYYLSYLLKSSEYQTNNVWKIENRPPRKNFFQGMELFCKNFDFNNICKNKLDDKNEKIISRFGDKLSQIIDFTAYGHHRDHPSAWE